MVSLALPVMVVVRHNNININIVVVLLCVAKICELLTMYDRVERLMESTPSCNNKYQSSVGTQPPPAINPYNAWSVLTSDDNSRITTTGLHRVLPNVV